MHDSDKRICTLLHEVEASRVTIYHWAQNWAWVYTHARLHPCHANGSSEWVIGPSAKVCARSLARKIASTNSGPSRTAGGCCISWLKRYNGRLLGTWLLRMIIRYRHSRYVQSLSPQHRFLSFFTKPYLSIWQWAIFAYSERIGKLVAIKNNLTFMSDGFAKYGCCSIKRTVES